MNRIQVNSSQIALRRAGESGPPVICLHCSSSHSGQYKPLLAELAPRYRLVAPDLHGYGQSDPLPHDGQPWFVYDRAMVGALLDQFPGEKVHLVGHSLGGVTAFFASREWPERIASLTLIEPVLFSLLAEAGLDEVAEGYRTSSEVQGYLRLKMPERAAQYFVDFWSGKGAWTALDDGTRRYITDTVDRVADDWTGVLVDLPEQAGISDCSAFGMPVQLIRGGASRASARAIIGLLAEALPGAEFHDVPGVDHMAPVARPDLINPLIVRFLDEHAANGA